MPLRFLTPFVEALAHVRAQASIRLAEAIGYGTGSYRKADREAIGARWNAATRRQPRRARDVGELEKTAAAAGIRFVRTPKHGTV